MKKKFAIYDRTFTSGDMIHPKHKDVEREVVKIGGMVLKVFTDLNHDGASARSGFKALMEFTEKGTLDGVAIYELPRLSTSGSAAIDDLLKLNSRGISFLSLKENINTDYSQQLFLWPLIRSLKEMNSAAHSRSVSSGMKKARANGQQIGRPGVPIEMLRLCVKYIRQLDEEPVEAYQPWQIQAKCDISGATYYGIRDVMRYLEKGLSAEEAHKKTTLGLSTAQNIKLILDEA